MLAVCVFEPPENLPPTLHPKFHHVKKKNCSAAAQFVRGSGKAESKKFHRQAQIQEGGKDRGSGSHRLDRECIPVPHQPWELGSRTLKQLACSLNALGLLGLHVMGIICRCPLREDVVHQNATFLSYFDACALKSEKHLICLNFLRHVIRAILSVRPKCSHRCVSLKESHLKLC